MSKSVIAYDKELPEIPGRCAWEKPTSFLVKDDQAPTGWRVDTSGRRASTLLLIKKMRAAVDRWREEGYPGASKVTRRLFEYWFEEDHDVPPFAVPFRYRYCLREAIETMVYLVEIVNNRDGKALIQEFAEVFVKDLYSKSIEFQTTMDGRRQLRRYVPELDGEGVQDLPPDGLRRYAFKLATGTGKTWVMAMAMVWSHFHKKRVPGSDLSTNFLIVAPNVIVYQRLEKDFGSNKIFRELPLVPPEWGWNQKVILRDDSAEPDASGNLFLTNVHQLYASRDQGWTPQNAIDALLGPKPAKDLASYQRSMMDRLKDLKDLVVLNDEAHHVHDEDLAWNRSLLTLHRGMPKGLALWLDFSATPKDQRGMVFPWTVCDYPLAQAVEDRIVKAPLIVTREDDPKLPAHDPEKDSKTDVVDNYAYWIKAAVQRWQAHYDTYMKLGTKPVLFIMAERNPYADAIGEYLRKTREFGFKKSEVLVIHTDEAGEVTKKDLEEARKVARDIDLPGNEIKAIVSVMMLREGWDVRNVSVVLGLRPFTARAEILPEQVIGRGLRLMTGVSPDSTQTLEVLGTRNLLEVLRHQLHDALGVAAGVTKSDPPRPIIIEPMKERLACDIGIPITKPRLTYNIRKLAALDPSTFEAIYDQKELDEVYASNLKMEFATLEVEVHAEEILPGPLVQDLLGSITHKVEDLAKLPSAFAKLYGLVRTYVTTRCFGKPVNIEDKAIQSYLQQLEMRDAIAKYLARKISALTVEKRIIEFEKASFKLSETKPFGWRRNLPAMVADKTLFNFVATYNNFERDFAEFLDRAADICRFASLATTEQGESGTPFRVDYLKPSGAIGFYHPDWVAVQKAVQGEINWILETKGRVWVGTDAKDAAMHDWCARVSEQTGQDWRFARVNQSDFDQRKPKTLADAVAKNGQEPSLWNVDPLEAARARGEQIGEELLAAEGGSLSPLEVSKILQLPPQDVEQMRLAGRLLAVTVGQKGHVFPSWQFAEHGLLPGFEEVLADLRSLSSWAQLQFFLNANLRLDGASPLQALRQARVAEVRRAARNYGEQGAV